jgi:hypothetical protein
MPKKGPRPHTWKVKDPVGHQQHIAWQRMRAQANFRGELYCLTFDEFQMLWNGHWNKRGRKTQDYCLTRIDQDLPWTFDNTVCVQRIEYLQRSLTDGKIYI